MNLVSPVKACIAAAMFITIGSTALLAAEPFRFTGAPCETPPVLHCPDTGCHGNVTSDGGPVVEPKTGRKYFLDYTCDLKKGEKITFVLSLHGAGAPGNWQRHYFPIFDYKDQNRLVIATPFSPSRVWSAADDEYLQNIVTSVIEQVGGNNIKAFWLVGHSQGGATSNRLVCTDFFKNKVDGLLSLSGGRVGGSPQRGGNFGNLAPRGAATAGGRGDAPRGGGAAPTLPSCDFSH